MRKLFLILTFLGLFQFVQGQDDVVKKQIKSVLMTIDSLVHIDLELTMIKLNQLDSILQIHPYDKYQWRSYLYRHNAYNVDDKMEEAEDYINKAYIITKEINDTSGLVTVGSNYANLLRRLNKNEEFIQKTEELIAEISDNKKFVNQKAYIYFIRGQHYQGENDSLSIRNFLTTLDILKNVDYEQLEAATYYSLGIIYRDQEKYDEAIKVLGEAEKLYGKNTHHALQVYNIWAKCLDGQGKVEEAIEKFNLVVNNSSATTANKIYAYKNAGAMMIRRERYDEAKVYLQKAIELSKNTKRYEREYAEVLGSFGRLLFKQKKYKDALKYFSKAKPIILESEDLQLKYKAELFEFSLEAEIGAINNIELMSTFQNFITMNDSLFVLSQNAIDEEMIEKYRSDLKEAKNQSLLTEQTLKENQINAQRKVLWGGGFMLGLVSLLSFLFYRQREKQKQLNETLTTQRDQIKLLNRELNHRVKNNLAFMTSLLEMQGRRTDSIETKQILRESESRLKALSIVHNNLFQNDTHTTINLKSYLLEIVQHLQNIFEIPGKSLQLETQLADLDFDAEDAMRVGLIVNELVTNSVKHAFANVDEPKIILETKQSEDGKIVLLYRDNGPGLTEKELRGASAKSGSIGIKLIQLLEKQLAAKLDLMVT